MPLLSPQKTVWTPFGTARMKAVSELSGTCSGVAPLRLSPALQALFQYFNEAQLDDVYFYQTLDMIRWASITPESFQELGLMAVFLYLRQSWLNGSTCLYLEKDLPAVAQILEKTGFFIARDIPDLLLQMLIQEGSPLVGGEGEFKPFILSREAQYLYHQNNFHDEGILVRYLEQRLRMNVPLPEPTETRQVLEEVLVTYPIMYGSQPLQLAKEQLLALLLALQSPLTIISGGPGTGKTSVVVSLLRTLSRLGLAQKIALAAPTGRAAKRMAEAIEAGLTHIRDIENSPKDQRLLENLREAQTLHRLLGYHPVTKRFRHHENYPLAMDVVVIDEASMIDLTLMSRLFRAVSPQRTHFFPPARLILLGDVNQLPSVGAGSVLKDLVPLSLSLSPSQGHELSQLAPELSVLINQYTTSSTDLFSGKSAHLIQSFRQKAEDPSGKAILDIASLIHKASSAEEVSQGLFQPPIYPDSLIPLSSLAENRYEKVAFLEQQNTSKQIKTFVHQWISDFLLDNAFLELIQQTYSLASFEQHWEDLRKLFEILNRFRILTLTRVLRTGSEAVNRIFPQLLFPQSRWTSQAFEAFYAGAPVMILENDYQNNLFNGDQGLFLKFEHPESKKIELKAVFPIEGAYQTFYDHQLKSHQLAYAITVHKSQGSEYDHVAIILPPHSQNESLGESASESMSSKADELLSKEMLYTALTRAKKSVLILGPKETLIHAASRKINRYSGIKSMLKELAS
ncbi:exodeoxyribonuclease V subunit alpha [Deltaproteobacteria bacterium TL4]